VDVIGNDPQGPRVRGFVLCHQLRFSVPCRYGPAEK
jgi:hypothetical protein